MAKPIEFESLSAAFAHCREADKPVVVKVEETIGTVYPSGYYRPAKAVQSCRQGMGGAS